jgi:hypothetical protein
MRSYHHHSSSLAEQQQTLYQIFSLSPSTGAHSLSTKKQGHSPADLNHEYVTPLTNQQVLVKQQSTRKAYGVVVKPLGITVQDKNMLTPLKDRITVSIPAKASTLGPKVKQPC